jgi:hypothetical protein
MMPYGPHSLTAFRTTSSPLRQILQLRYLSGKRGVGERAKLFPEVSKTFSRRNHKTHAESKLGAANIAGCRHIVWRILSPQLRLPGERWVQRVSEDRENDLRFRR